MAARIGADGAELGQRQREVLDWLTLHQSWNPASHSQIVGRYVSDTTRILETLRKRGLVEFTDGEYQHSLAAKIVLAGKAA